MIWTHHTPFWVRWIYPRRIWSKPHEDRTIFLTFDDGPQPEATPFVIDQLAQYDAQATFFIIGRHGVNHHKMMEVMLKHGHLIANHGYEHLNGWRTDLRTYWEDFEKCEQVLSEFRSGDDPLLFRPPFGRMTFAQAAKISSTHQIVMWDMLSGDFDYDLDPDHAFGKITKYDPGGSIIVFHDSDSFHKNLTGLLPRFLRHYSELGYKFDRLH